MIAHKKACKKFETCKYQARPSEIAPGAFLVGMTVKKNWRKFVNSRSTKCSECIYSKNEQIMHVGSRGVYLLHSPLSETADGVRFGSKIWTCSAVNRSF